MPRRAGIGRSIVVLAVIAVLILAGVFVIQANQANSGGPATLNPNPNGSTTASTSTLSLNSGGSTSLTSSTTSTSTTSNATTTIATSTLTALCASPFPKPPQVVNTQNSDEIATISALVLSPNSAATFCIRYGGSYDNQTIPESSFSAYVAVVTSKSDGEFVYSAAPGINVTSNATSTFGSRTLIIVYTIRAASNASGIYYLSFPNVCASLMPLVVTTNPQSLKSSDFSTFFRLASGSCTLGYPPGKAVVVGFEGLGIDWISHVI